MRTRGGQGAVQGDLLLLGICVAISLAALALPANWASALSAGIRRTILRPLVAAQTRAEQDRLARFDLAAIQFTRDSLAQLVQQTEAVRGENDNLRGLLLLQNRVRRPFVATEVLHRPTPMDPRMLLLGGGESRGIAAFDPVVTAEGLVGYVWSVGPASAAALTWQHPEFRASAVTADGRVLGIVSPTSPSEGGHVLLQLRGVALRDSLAIGTVVYTAGLGGVYPRGIPIGTVREVALDALGYERLYLVRPFVNPGRAWHVSVITAPRDSVFLPLPSGEVLP
jgi:rod shape-determining protein MreC